MKIRKNSCYNCKNWCGDRELTLEYAKASGGDSFDVMNGWSPTGRCVQDIEWMDTNNGDGPPSYITVDAAFCCNLFERRCD